MTISTAFELLEIVKQDEYAPRTYFVHKAKGVSWLKTTAAAAAILKR
jgi:hypothetical protein